MKRLLISMLTGLLFAVAFLGISFAADGTGTFHWLREIFTEPPLWVLRSGLPAISPAFTIEPGGPYSGATFFLLFFMLFWWLVCSVVAFTLGRQPPNSSFKPKPLRGSA